MAVFLSLKEFALKIKGAGMYRYHLGIQWQDEHGKTHRLHQLEFQAFTLEEAFSLWVDHFTRSGGELKQDEEGVFFAEPQNRVVLVRTTDPRIWVRDRSKMMVSRIEPWCWGFFWGCITTLSMWSVL